MIFYWSWVAYVKHRKVGEDMKPLGYLKALLGSYNNEAIPVKLIRYYM